MDQSIKSSCENKWICKTKVEVNVVCIYTTVQKFGFRFNIYIYIYKEIDHLFSN